MKQKYKLGLGMVVVALLIAVTTWYLRRHSIAVLQPAGTIGHSERNLIIFATSLSLVVVLPVFALLGVFAYKYREGNTKAKYSPELDGSRLAETIWWLVPTLLIGSIAVVTWRSSYALDPYKPIASAKPALHVQVVALDWKWLFIYPDQNLASVNELTLPANTPVDFEITSDSVMNSFWVPQLGGQMYAMPGMSTQLNLMANKLGTYRGQSANISGKGFADMSFQVHVIKPELYSLWAKSMRVGNSSLGNTAYAQLTKPGIVPAGELHRYSSVAPGLFDTVVMKYMMPMGSPSDTMSGMDGMSAMHGMSM